MALVPRSVFRLSPESRPSVSDALRRQALATSALRSATPLQQGYPYSYQFPYGFPYGGEGGGGGGGGGGGDLDGDSYYGEDNGAGDMLDDDGTYEEEPGLQEEQFYEQPDVYAGGEYPEEIEQSLAEEDIDDIEAGGVFPDEGSVGGA